MNGESITVTATKINSTLLLQLYFLISSQLQIRKLKNSEISREEQKAKQGLRSPHVAINEMVKWSQF